MTHGPDSSQREQKHSGEDQETIACAPLNDSRDHDYIPPVALSVSCLLAIVCPFCCALMVTCQVPPELSSTLPSYIPPPSPSQASQPCRRSQSHLLRRSVSRPVQSASRERCCCPCAEARGQSSVP